MPYAIAYVRVAFAEKAIKIIEKADIFPLDPGVFHEEDFFHITSEEPKQTSSESNRRPSKIVKKSTSSSRPLRSSAQLLKIIQSEILMRALLKMTKKFTIVTFHFKELRLCQKMGINQNKICGTERKD